MLNRASILARKLSQSFLTPSSLRSVRVAGIEPYRFSTPIGYFLRLRRLESYAQSGFDSRTKALSELSYSFLTSFGAGSGNRTLQVQYPDWILSSPQKARKLCSIGLRFSHESSLRAFLLLPHFVRCG